MNEYSENIPEFLIEKLKIQYGKEIANQILEGYKAERKVTFRVNTLKSNNEEISKKLKELGINFEKVEWSKDAFIINNKSKQDIQELDMYKNGEIYMQSLSSMLPPIILNPKQNTDILDMAAAPGGKTTQIAAICENKANITACEMNSIRAERLKYNIEKQGASVYVMLTDARRINDMFSFDQILLDAPCSGSGTLESKDERIKDFFTEKLINKSTASQYDLLKKAISILKQGKEMVYSTCSILEEENEEIINKILKQENVEMVPIEFEGMKELQILPTKIQGTICICPNELYEGFFVAKIRKTK